MNLRTPSPRQLEQLFQDQEDDCITPADHRWLMNLLRSRPEIRRAYLEHMGLAAGLHELAAAWGPEHAVPLGETREAGERRVLRRSFLAAAALVALLAIAGSLFIFRGDARPPATAVAGAGTIWTFSRGGIDPLGDLLPNTKVAIDAGTLEITTRSRTRIVLEGPAEFEIHDPVRSSLARGSVWVDVSPEDPGFTVTTPHLRVIDLGTTFGVATTSFEDHIQVASGRVRLESLFPGISPMELGSGEAARADLVGRLTRVPFQPGRFLEAPASLHAAVYAHYSFDSDFTDSSDNARHGALVDVGTSGNSGIVSSAGNFVFGGGAMSFSADRDYIALPMATFGSGTPYTIAFWAKKASTTTGDSAEWDMVIGDRDNSNFFIALNDGTPAGAQGLRWRSSAASAARQADFATPNDTSWHHYAVVASTTTISLYFDGSLLATGTGKMTGFQYNTIGEAYLEAHNFGFSGQIDELYIIRMALSDAQIERLFRENRFSVED